MKLVVLYILAMPVALLVLRRGVGAAEELRATYQPGPHGLTEMVYTFASAANNNGSAFAGLRRRARSGTRRRWASRC